jgi:hypothetical protein
MTNQGGMGGFGCPGVEQSFETSGRAFEKQGSYRCSFGRHGLKDYTRVAASWSSLGNADVMPRSSSNRPLLAMRVLRLLGSLHHGPVCSHVPSSRYRINHPK